MEAPLSPSRYGNALPSLGAPTPRKRIVFEEDDDFFAASALAEAEQEEEQQQPQEVQQPPSSPVKERVAPVASTSAQRLPSTGAMEQQQPFVRDSTEVPSRPGVKEGKRRIVLEPEEGFGDGMDLDGERRV